MKKLSAILALILAFTLTACSNSSDADTPPALETDRQPLSDAPAQSATTTTASEAEGTDDIEPFIPGARYYKLPDGSIYTAPSDVSLFLLGFAMVRENADVPNDETKWQTLCPGDKWNGLRVEYARCGLEMAGFTYSTAGGIIHHQTINFKGEKTFTGKAEILYAADGETPAYTVFYVDEESGGEMPLFPTYQYDEDNGYQPVFFTLWHEDYVDKFEEITNLLSEGKEVTVTITTDDFMWEYSEYGLSIDGNTRGYFNTILSFEIS